jgi:hypothetical protein
MLLPVADGADRQVVPRRELSLGEAEAQTDVLHRRDAAQLRRFLFGQRLGVGIGMRSRRDLPVGHGVATRRILRAQPRWVAGIEREPDELGDPVLLRLSRTLIDLLTRTS